jgi:hypothetical protein
MFTFSLENVVRRDCLRHLCLDGDIIKTGLRERWYLGFVLIIRSIGGVSSFKDTWTAEVCLKCFAVMKRRTI